MENQLFDEMIKVETQHWWFVARRKIIESVIKNLNLENNSLILDAGCGNGDNLSMLKKFGDVTAMERDENALANAKARNIGNVMQGELPNGVHSDIKKENDLVVLLDVLEHIDDDAESLSVLRKYTKHDGSLVITVPAYQFLWTKHDEKHHHKRRYNAGNLKKIVEECGWDVNYISYFNTFLFPLALIDRIKQKLFPPSKDIELKVPPKFINYLFEKIFSFESKLISKLSLPFGLSLLVVAKKI